MHLLTSPDWQAADSGTPEPSADHVLAVCVTGTAGAAACVDVLPLMLHAGIDKLTMPRPCTALVFGCMSADHTS